MQSIVQDELEDRCFLCGSTTWLERHHCIGGSYRKLSDRYGLTVKLCHRCHNEPPIGVHFNKDAAMYLRQAAQKAFEKKYSHDEFLRVFGRNFL